MVKYYIAIDNGVSGGITVIDKEGKICMHEHTPVKKELSYTKKKQWLNRIDTVELEEIISFFSMDCVCCLERPMINPARFTASISAARALEATLIVMERLGVAYLYLDSKEWQKAMLPSGLVGDELKKSAECIVKRLFPSLKVKNSDSVLMAEFMRRKNV